MKSWLSVVLAVVLWSVSIAGGVLYEVPGPPAPSVYDRAWSAALGGAEDVGVQVASADPTVGLIRGTKDGIGVTVIVAREPDGSVRVHMDTTGPTRRDPDLQDRFLQAYNRRRG
jgi:hypothetical protein